MAESSIEWTEATWNPLAGCSLISPGCTNCYAMRMAARLTLMGMEKYQGTTRKSGSRYVWTGQVNLDEGALSAPLRWQRPTTVFVNSMSDLFQEAVPEETVERIWKVMAQTPRHTYQVLTKRAARMRAIAARLPKLPNVWLGVSVESRDYVDRVSDLRDTPAAVRFISFEPLLGSVGDIDLRDIHWAIVGGESGPAARPMRQEWVEEVLAACRRDGTAFFFKQWGGANKKKAGRTFLGQTWDEYPLTGMGIAAE